MTNWGEWRAAAMKRVDEHPGLDPAVREELIERIEQFASDEKSYEPDPHNWEDPVDFVDDELDEIFRWR